MELHLWFEVVIMTCIIWQYWQNNELWQLTFSAVHSSCCLSHLHRARDVTTCFIQPCLNSMSFPYNGIHASTRMEAQALPRTSVGKSSVPLCPRWYLTSPTWYWLCALFI